MSPATHSSAGTDVRSLLTGEIVQLYQNNPFRVLNVPFDATLREIEKRLQRLRVLHQTGQHTLDEFALREAMQTLRDPQRRLLAELFWFSLDSSPSSPDVQAIQKLREGKWLEARELWVDASRHARGEEARRAIHNLAVLLHARVVTREAGGNPLFKRMTGNAPLPQEVLSGWREALQAWSLYWRDGANWEFWRNRVRVLADRRLRDDFVDELRELLPDALLQINRDLARHYADAGFGLAAGAHCQLMQQSGFAPELAAQYARTVLDPVRERIATRCDELKADARTINVAAHGSPSLALNACLDRFRQAAGNDIMMLSQIDEKKAFGASSARENIAKALKFVAVEHVSHGRNDFGPCLRLLDKALPFVDSPILRRDIHEVSQQVARLNTIWSRSPGRCLLCSLAPVDWMSFTKRGTMDTRLVFYCQIHAQPSYENQVMEVVDRTWHRLPVAPPQL